MKKDATISDDKEDVISD